MPNVMLLKNRMLTMHWSQKELSERLGIAQPTLSQKLNGIRPFFLSEAEKLANLLEIEDDDFGLYFFDRDLHNAKSDTEIQSK